MRRRPTHHAACPISGEPVDESGDGDCDSDAHSDHDAGNDYDADDGCDHRRQPRPRHVK